MSPKGYSEFLSNEVFEFFSRSASLLAHKGNAQSLVLIARVDHSGQEIVDWQEAHIGLAGVEECQIFRIAVRIVQGIGQEQHEGELTKSLELGRISFITDLVYTRPSAISPRSTSNPPEHKPE